jgi:predicted cupin superfamily sugar epimerase
MPAMTRCIATALVSATLCASVFATEPLATPQRAQELIETLGLKPLNIEAGLFAVERVSDLPVMAGDGSSPASNAIYLMLTRDVPQNYIQWLYSDDYQVLIEGGPADYYLFYPDGSSEKITMGRDVAAGQRPLVPAPAGSAKAIVLAPEAEYLLVGSILSPAWSPARARIGIDDAFVQRYAGSSPWATPGFLAFLAGPNVAHVAGGSEEDLAITVAGDGQFLWQGMQLTEKQLRNQLSKFTGEHPDAPVSLAIEPGAPPAAVASARAALADAGVALPE